MADGNGDWRGLLIFGMGTASMFYYTHYVNQQNRQRLLPEKTAEQEFEDLFQESTFDDQFENIFLSHKDEIRVPEEYLDPITHHLMDDPVTLSDNQTYNRNTALFLLKYKKRSPITREELVEGFIDPNDKLKSEIDSWIIALRYEYRKGPDFI